MTAHSSNLVPSLRHRTGGESGRVSNGRLDVGGDARVKRFESYTMLIAGVAY